MKHEHRAGRFAPVSYLKNVVPKGQVQFSGIELFFWAAYAASAFTAAYLQEKGYSASVVGLIMALVNCIGIVAAPMMGSLSDRLSSSRRVFLLCIAVSSVLLRRAVHPRDERRRRRRHDGRAACVGVF